MYKQILSTNQLEFDSSEPEANGWIKTGATYLFFFFTTPEPKDSEIPEMYMVSTASTFQQDD